LTPESGASPPTSIIAVAWGIFDALGLADHPPHRAVVRSLGDKDGIRLVITRRTLSLLISLDR